MKLFANDVSHIESMWEDERARRLIEAYFENARRHKYVYNFSWLGLPILQHPADMAILQEIVWLVKPELIIETGIAHGGSLVFYASLLELIGESGTVLGVDVDIRPYNKHAIQTHPMAKRIDMIQGSSIESYVIAEVDKRVCGKEHVMVILDSNHTHAHVLEELRNYGRFVTKGSYLVVCDTRIDDMPAELFRDRPWRPGNSPRTAVVEYLTETDRFCVDKEIEKRILLTGNPDGYLRCVRE